MLQIRNTPLVLVKEILLKNMLEHLLIVTNYNKPVNKYIFGRLFHMQI